MRKQHLDLLFRSQIPSARRHLSLLLARGSRGCRCRRKHAIGQLQPIHSLQRVVNVAFTAESIGAGGLEGLFGLGLLGWRLAGEFTLEGGDLAAKALILVFELFGAVVSGRWGVFVD